jgi:hypothetical protein
MKNSHCCTSKTLKYKVTSGGDVIHLNVKVYVSEAEMLELPHIRCPENKVFTFDTEEQ